MVGYGQNIVKTYLHFDVKTLRVRSMKEGLTMIPKTINTYRIAPALLIEAKVKILCTLLEIMRWGAAQVVLFATGT